MTVTEQVLALGMSEDSANIFWSFGGRAFSRRQSPDETYLEGVSRCPGAWRDLRSESVDAARKISELPFQKKTLLLSGGLDSEFVLAAFLAAKQPVRALVFDFEFNRAEIAHAERFCRDHGVPLVKHRFDARRFWQGDLARVATKAGCVSPPICALLAAVSEVDEYVIVGDGELDIFAADDRFFESRGERWAMARWLLQTEHPGCPAFFRYTASLEAAFFFEPMVEDFQLGWQTLDHGWLSGLRYFIYYHHLGVRWRKKYYGFRELPEWQVTEGVARKDLLNLLPGHDAHCTIEFELMKRIKKGELRFEALNFQDVASAPLSEKTRQYLRFEAPGSCHRIALNC